MSDADRIRDLETRLNRVCDSLPYLLFCIHELADGKVGYLERADDTIKRLMRHCQQQQEEE